MIEIVEDLDLGVQEFLLAKRISETLCRQYPGYKWAVNVNRSVIDIRALDASGDMGYTLHVVKEYSASEMDVRVMRAGGEILERHALRRGVIDHAQVAAAPRDFAGRLFSQ